MPSTILRLLVVCCILIPWKLAGQDKIYFASSVIPCKITDVTTTTVTYLPLKSSKAVTVYVNKVLFLFNEKGLFLQPSKMDFSLKQTQQLVKTFLHDEDLKLSTDRIYKTDKTIVDAPISKEDKAFVYLDDNQKIDKKTVAAIIYKDGSHQVFAPATKTAEVLWAAHESKNNVSPKGSVITERKETEVKPATENKDLVVEKTPAATSSKMTAEEKAPVGKTAQAPTQENSVKQTTEKPASSTPESLADKPTINDVLTSDLKLSFEKKATEKTTQFSNYLKIICDKKAEDEVVNKAMDQAVLLFVNEDATIEVSSLNKVPVKHKIKRYLGLLKGLKYDKIELKWTNVQYVTDIKKGMDGNFYGTITFEQQFTGYKDGRVVYSDITIKKSVVILKTYEKVVDGRAVTLWDVLLGDIGVEVTMSANS
jgi:hypothetical protein